MPLSSLLVATEPLAPAVLDQIGLASRPTFADDRLMVIYGQRTDDGRIVFGGRGVPYRFGSRIGEPARPELRAHLEHLAADESVPRHKLFKGLGPEPLDPAFTLARFRRLIRGRRGRLKPLPNWQQAYTLQFVKDLKVMP